LLTSGGKADAQDAGILAEIAPDGFIRGMASGQGDRTGAVRHSPA